MYVYTLFGRSLHEKPVVVICKFRRCFNRHLAVLNQISLRTYQYSEDVRSHRILVDIIDPFSEVGERLLFS